MNYRSAWASGTARESTPRETPGKHAGGARSDGKALPAAAFALHVGIFEAKSLIEPLLHEVDDRAVDERKTRRIDEYLHAAILENDVTWKRRIGVVDDIRKPRTTGLAHAQTQADTGSTSDQEALHSMCCGFSKRYRHRFGKVSVSPFYAGSAGGHKARV